MKRILFIFSSLLIMGVAICQTTVDNYRFRYGAIIGATATITHKKSVENGKTLTTTTLDGRTRGLADALFRVHDIFSSTYDEQFLPVSAYRDIHEGKTYTKREDLSFDRSAGTVTSSLSGTEHAAPKLRDMVSALMYVANVDYSNVEKGSRTKYYVFHEEEQFPIEVKYNGIEDVKMNKKTYRCYSISPLVDPGNLLEKKESLIVYVDIATHKIVGAKLHFKLAGYFRLEIVE